MSLVFVEGVSGVGKSTLVRELAGLLTERGLRARSFIEGDITNPIDLYRAAYLPEEKRRELRDRYPGEAEALDRRAVPAGQAAVVRYFDRDRPLFSGPLLGELMERELCYAPREPVPFEKYAEVYEALWRRFAAGAEEGTVYIFDGSLMHHPINDMIRNYAATPETAADHVRMLLGALDGAVWRVVYLSSQDLPGTLRAARRSRGRREPTETEIGFWERRGEYDRFVLERAVVRYRTLDVSLGWNGVLEAAVESLRSGCFGPFGIEEVPVDSRRFLTTTL